MKIKGLQNKKCTGPGYKGSQECEPFLFYSLSQNKDRFNFYYAEKW
jgi:hypothetical protein